MCPANLSTQRSDLCCPVSLVLGRLEKNEIPPSCFFPTANSGHYLSGKETEAERRDPHIQEPCSWPLPDTRWRALGSWGFGELLTLASFSDLVTGLWLYPPMPTTVCFIKVRGRSRLQRAFVRSWFPGERVDT